MHIVQVIKGLIKQCSVIRLLIAGIMVTLYVQISLGMISENNKLM